MTVDELVRLYRLGGPGHDGYAYRADVYCVDCGRAIVERIAPEVAPLVHRDDLLWRDSETLPQPIFFGESDVREHCADCGKYLYGGDDEDE